MVPYLCFNTGCRPYNRVVMALSIGGLRRVVQVRDAYCCSGRFSVVWCETSLVQIKGLVLVLPI